MISKFAVLILFIFIKHFNCKRPNVLIIVADDLGWDDVSFHGSKQIYTPNIDALASDGITFTNYYVSPLCTPSRSALLTGKHPIHTGTQHFVIAAASPWGTSLDVKMFPQYLKELGYKTHLVGKWHQGHHKKEFLPTYRGFDSHFGYRHGKGDYYDHSDLERYWGYDIWRDLKPVYKEYNNSYSTTIYKDEVKTLIKSYQNSSHPFFIMFSPMAVHAGGSYSSFQAPKEYVDRFPHIKDLHRRMFAGMLAALDDAIGEIFEELSKSEAIDNTIILFTSDNGGVPSGFSQETSAGSNWPLRGAKYTLWEGGVKGISFLWSKLLKKSGYIYENLIHIQDWLPTLYSAIGGSKSSLPSDLDGKDFWEALSNAKREPVRSEILHNIDDKLGVYALRYKNYKIVYGTNYNGELDGWFKPAGSESEKNKFEYNGVVSEILKKYGAKLEPKQIKIKCGKKPSNAVVNCKLQACVFNIKSDPCEYNNIADKEVEMKNYLVQRVLWHNKTAIAPNNKPRDPKANPLYHNDTWDVWQ